ncbi:MULTISPECIES: MCE family protein [Mycolicibacterium]|uniref:MlaD family protein n=3 Tax=Mycolicibacterium TaxID=1866885 RepID=A0AAE4VEU0_MYCFO|nr:MULTISPECIES: MlaD family protein [Mycolicibacterium]MCV7142469.1 MCE family protein [Mycolicibacterium fortuitum]MDV7193431.1 MlaD family protein [Mycolicibacterium fortuitum]MDV7206800.1 MlaD family protein [Mycolicibacterium fortuitum]MDV7228318.1 MlaD family protein [Mycolicibacterium fortuitum]MDV7260426.1 MlaD family protein [Mycolicibacterium fortuitum]
MHMTRRIWIQLIAFLVVSTVAFAVMAFGYMGLPNLLFGVGHYQVTVQLPEAGGLYARGNVTYRGTEVGQVKDVRLIKGGGVEAVLSLRSDVRIPSDLQAEVHSQTAVGEQFVALLPRNADSPPLRDGDVITRANSSVPPDINSLLDATNRGLLAIPQDDLRTTIDEAYNAVGGLGPDIARFVKGSTALATDARQNLGDLTNLVDQAWPILDTQTDTSNSVQAWTSHLATITQQLRDNDGAVAGILEKGAPAAAEVRALIDRVQPTLPILAANLANVAPVLITYRADLEQLLVLLPQATAMMQAISVPSMNNPSPYAGGLLAFNLNLNLPPPCTTGFLPAQQRRTANFEDYPERPAGDLYCRVPQDSPLGVRGARNIPCETVPGKRAPTVKLCESDENYVPLNDGFNWKGDPNATLTGQGVPQLPPGSTGPAPPIAVAQYDPATGDYVGPDGKLYNQADVGQNAPKDKNWQTMLIPPTP